LKSAYGDNADQTIQTSRCDEDPRPDPSRFGTHHREIGDRGGGVNALAREAGIDKVLIYRYFGGLNCVFRTFATQRRFWWTLDELLDGVDPKRHSLAVATQLILRRHTAALRSRPMALAVLAAELTDRTVLVMELRSVREKRSLELKRWLLLNCRLPEGLDFEVSSMLLGAAVNYLVPVRLCASVNAGSTVSRLL
jgi:AcrR family transcriptional regulator